MPELPEVEIVKRGIEPVLIGQSLDTLILNRPDLRFPIPTDLPSRLQGQVFSSIQRRGKYILAFTQSGAGFVLHLGMSGVVRIEGANDEPESLKHDHVIFQLKDGGRIVFNDPRRFGFLDSIDEQRWETQAPFNAMGPEPLSNSFNGALLAERLKSRKGPIKTALLDQKLVAGVGNIYACEALYMSGISPKRSAHTVQGARAEKLAQAIRAVLEKAIAAGGSTLKDYRHANGDLGYFQHEFGVYGRAGETCPDCSCDLGRSGGIKQITQSGRSTFFCSEKQR